MEEYPYQTLFIPNVNMKFRIEEEQDTRFSVVNDKGCKVWIDKLPNITPHELVTRLITIITTTITNTITTTPVYIPDFIHKSSEECMHMLDMCSSPTLAKLWFMSWMILLSGAIQEDWVASYAPLVKVVTHVT